MKYEVAGDPVSGLRWTRKTTKKIAAELSALGIRVSRKTVAKLLKQMNFSLRILLASELIHAVTYRQDGSVASVMTFIRSDEAYGTVPMLRVVPRSRFNGAAFSRTRKRRRRVGRGQLEEAASMGPRSHERGNNERSNPLRRAVYGFNGAAFSRTRKRDVGRMHRGYTGPASMGPRSHERGNATLVACTEVTQVVLLQWGRVLTNAETLRGFFDQPSRPACFNGAAFSRTRKLRRQRARRHRAPSFNGAAFSRTRKQRQL